MNSTDGRGRSNIVAVTGSNGFVGRHVTSYLAAEGFTVRALTRTPREDVAGVPFPYTGLNDTARLRAAFSGADSIVHLAARVHQFDGDDNAGLYHDVNVQGTAAVVDEAVASGARLLIFLSSVKAVGEKSEPGKPWDESTTPLPADPYGRSKLKAERVALARSEGHELTAVALRVPIVHGPGMGANMLRLFRAVQRGLPLPFALVENRRSLIHVDTLAAAIKAVISAVDPPPGVYFVSDRPGLSSADMVRAIADGMGRRAWLPPIPPAVLRAAGLTGDVLSRVAPWPLGSAQISRMTGSLEVDPSLFERTFDFQPPVSSREGLAATAAALENARGGN